MGKKKVFPYSLIKERSRRSLMAKEKMSRAGYTQGDMTPRVRDYQTPDKCYSQKDDAAPLDYIERQDDILGKEASQLDRQDYRGKYQ